MRAPAWFSCCSCCKCSLWCYWPKDAFRAYHINLVMLTYCYQVRDEWCIDLRDPFGNVMSEYTYATIVSTQMDIWMWPNNCIWRQQLPLVEGQLFMSTTCHLSSCSVPNAWWATRWDWDVQAASFHAPTACMLTVWWYQQVGHLEQRWMNFLPFLKLSSLLDCYNGCPPLAPR